MKDTGALRQALAEYLRENGLDAVTAWSGERRFRAGRALAAVSLRGMESGASGFQDYLGEWYDEDLGEWREVYGKRVELTFGLDLSAASAQEVQTGVDLLGEALSRGGPGGLRPVGFSVGETAYREEDGRYFCPVRARFAAWAAADGEAGGTFVDFVVRGENRG